LCRIARSCRPIGKRRLTTKITGFFETAIEQSHHPQYTVAELVSDKANVTVRWAMFDMGKTDIARKSMLQPVRGKAT
jgi:hypothetical protein